MPQLVRFGKVLTRVLDTWVVNVYSLLIVQQNSSQKMTGQCYLHRCHDGSLYVKVKNTEWTKCPYGEAIQVLTYFHFSIHICFLNSCIYIYCACISWNWCSVNSVTYKLAFPSFRSLIFITVPFKLLYKYNHDQQLYCLIWHRWECWQVLYYVQQEKTSSALSKKTLQLLHRSPSAVTCRHHRPQGAFCLLPLWGLVFTLMSI